MAITLQTGVLRVIALLSGITFVSGCTLDPANSPPAPISGSQNLSVTEAPRPPAAAPSRRRTAAVRSAIHRPVVATLKSKRHASIDKKRRARVKTAKPPAQHNAMEQETATNAGVVHHIGPKIVPLD